MNGDCRIRRKKKPLENVLQDINRRYVRIREKERKCNNKILYSVLRELLKIMRKKVPLFNSMKPELEYLGSYYDGLRVGQPTEYDINIMLKLPMNYSKIILDASDVKNFEQTVIYMPSEFRRLHKVPATAEMGYHETRMWCDKLFRLSVKKFYSWMQSVVDLALESLRERTLNGKAVLCINNKYYPISMKTSGPALTLRIQIGHLNSEIIDVDLVPTFSFSLPMKPKHSKIDFVKVEHTKISKYFVVPKPDSDEYCWRLAFPRQERYYLDNKNNLKSALKLTKLLRDAQGFKLLASYYIKSLFLHEIQSIADDSFWKKHSLSYIFLHMLKRLKESLAKNEIKNFWCSDLNVIESKIKPLTCKNWSNRLSVIINDLEENGKRDPYSVMKYFTV